MTIESISSGVDFEKEIYKGIDGADNFVFVISPDAVDSEYCEREVTYAGEQNKRFISVLHRETDPATMPEALRKINWIDFKDIRFEKSFPELIQAIELDREYAHQHTVLQQRSGDWVENNRSDDFLLNITNCKKAKKWREQAKTKQPFITELQEEFIQRSLEFDREYAYQHNLWQQKAVDWIKNDRSDNFLLKLANCKKAKKWQEQTKEKPKQPLVTDIQEEFIQKSRFFVKKILIRNAFIIACIIFTFIIAKPIKNSIQDFFFVDTKCQKAESFAENKTENSRASVDVLSDVGNEFRRNFMMSPERPCPVN
ncbi:toll/interleukin-1 receptor domain-containing protein [Candidatus Halobeggiatoa sp. HSG11]|nr:toll/interleukin-1 receptor domain-containing protein [Candidatus Halobeggiatoa sp. HSG11]